MTADLRQPGIAATPANLQAVDYRIVPVNRAAETILGRRAHPSSASVSAQVDGVQVSRPADEAAAIARDVVAIGAGVLWLQQGLPSAAMGEIASAAGIGYLEDTCLGAHVASVPDSPSPPSHERRRQPR